MAERRAMAGDATLRPHRRSRPLLLQLPLASLDRLRSPLERLGIDYPVFRELVRIKLLLELRSSRRAGIPVGSATVLTILLFLAAGILTGVLAASTSSPSWWIAMSTGLHMTLLVTMLLTEYGHILLDPADIDVIALHPVADRTLAAARLAHALLVVAVLSAAFGFGSVALGALSIAPWWSVITVYPVILALCALTALGVFGCVLTALLQAAGPRYYRRLTIALQIVAASALVASGYLLPELPYWSAPPDVSSALTSLRYALPPVHMAGLFEFATGNASPENLILATMACGIPVLALIVTLRLASHHFVAALLDDSAPGRIPVGTWKTSLASGLGRWLTVSRSERAAYDFAVSMSRREVDFLRRALPLLVAFCIVGLSMSVKEAAPGVIPLATGPLLMCLPIVAGMAQSSRDWEARWAFQMGRSEASVELVAGTVKGLMVSIMAPACMVVGGLLVAWHGLRYVPHVLLAIELDLVVVLFFTSRWPFMPAFTCTERSATDSMGNIGRIMAMAAAVMVCSAIHVVLCRHWISLWGALFGAMPLIARQFRRLHGTVLPRGAFGSSQ